MVLLKFFLILTLMILLIRKKLCIGMVLIIAAILVGFLFEDSYMLLPLYVFNSIISYITIKLIIIVFSIFLLALLLKEGDINKMLKGVVNIIPDLRIAIMFPPAIIGLLPMPGGAMLSAPIVESIGNKLAISPTQKVFINYWYRHIWEYAWPLYPGLILTVSILQISIKQLMIHQFYLSIIAILSGLWVVLGVKRVKYNNRELNMLNAIFHLLYGIWPIILIIILLLLTNIRIEIIIFSIVMLYFLITKINIRRKMKILFNALKIETLLLIIGVILFKDILNNTNALFQFINVFPETEFFSIFLLIVLPFIIGLLTGINQGYVGIALPVLLPFLYTSGNIDMVKVTLFYASGFAGVLLSPVHLCLLLTVDYFKSDFSRIYKLLFPSVAPIFLIPFIVFLLRRFL